MPRVLAAFFVSWRFGLSYLCQLPCSLDGPVLQDCRSARAHLHSRSSRDPQLIFSLPGTVAASGTRLAPHLALAQQQRPHTCSGIHAHIQRSVSLFGKAEPSAWVVDLPRADAEVQENPGDAVLVHHVRHARKVALHGLKHAALSVGLQPLRSSRDGLSIAVDSQDFGLQRRRVRCFAQHEQQRGGVAAAAQGSVDVNSAGIRHQPLAHLLAEHWGVVRAAEGRGEVCRRRGVETEREAQCTEAAEQSKEHDAAAHASPEHLRRDARL
eukprot:scaffold1809_cov228-Pinguiococcus_pyrenoidosus.AAC.13